MRRSNRTCRHFDAAAARCRKAPFPLPPPHAPPDSRCVRTAYVLALARPAGETPAADINGVQIRHAPMPIPSPSMGAHERKAAALLMRTSGYRIPYKVERIGDGVLYAAEPAPRIATQSSFESTLGSAVPACIPDSAGDTRSVACIRWDSRPTLPYPRSGLIHRVPARCSCTAPLQAIAPRCYASSTKGC